TRKHFTRSEPIYPSRRVAANELRGKSALAVYYVFSQPPCALSRIGARPGGARDQGALNEEQQLIGGVGGMWMTEARQLGLEHPVQPLPVGPCFGVNGMVGVGQREIGRDVPAAAEPRRGYRLADRVEGAQDPLAGV